MISVKKYKEGPFEFTFLILALFFFFYFYCLPYIIFLLVDNVTYIGHPLELGGHSVSVVAAGILFVFGFFCYDILKKLQGKQFANRALPKSVNGSPNCILYFLAFLLIMFLLFKLANSNPEAIYSVRRGDTQGSHLEFFLTSIFGVVKLVVIIILMTMKRSLWVLLFLLLSLTVDFLGSIGRTTLLLSLSLVFLYISRLSAYRYSLIAFVSFACLVPVILVLKSVIYSVSVSGQLPNIAELVDGSDFSIYLDNFGHPFISLMKAESLVNNIGHRYMYDYLQGFVFYLRVLGFDSGDSITYFNTENLMGIKSSIIPPGYLAFGYVQLGYLGVFWAGATYRFIGYLAKKVYLRIGCNSEAVKFLLAFMAANTFYHGDFRIMVLSYFLPLSVIYFTSRVFFIKFRLK
ncbi:hypothetical protein CWC14_04960 [Pseudoalteromonas sp. S3260]|uniref:hypothetical protein n=1 Tax=Pseudoalteromonas sp. S3260 TaxID=579534 RepID=UPI00110B8D63|nr:hypothetical protein [Pseudoalteromonas sp. S3260]TMO99295.1 hypothetical protein CWC14_04960 [Pseudoalteromonas sp. S3260]